MVNFRLKNQETEDPKYPKFQFPPQFLCQNCLSNEVNNDSPNNWPEYKNFNELIVNNYLIKYYSNIKPIIKKQ